MEAIDIVVLEKEDMDFMILDDLQLWISNDRASARGLGERWSCKDVFLFPG